MACPRCSSNDLWDDNLAWGCNRCGYMVSNDGRPSMLLAKDIPGLARSLRDIPSPARSRVVREVPDNQTDEDY